MFLEALHCAVANEYAKPGKHKTIFRWVPKQKLKQTDAQKESTPVTTEDRYLDILEEHIGFGAQ